MVAKHLTFAQREIGQTLLEFFAFFQQLVPVRAFLEDELLELVLWVEQFASPSRDAR